MELCQPFICRYSRRHLSFHTKERLNILSCEAKLWMNSISAWAMVHEFHSYIVSVYRTCIHNPKVLYAWNLTWNFPTFSHAPLWMWISCKLWDWQIAAHGTRQLFIRCPALFHLKTYSIYVIVFQVNLISFFQWSFKNWNGQCRVPLQSRLGHLVSDTLKFYHNRQFLRLFSILGNLQVSFSLRNIATMVTVYTVLK